MRLIAGTLRLDTRIGEKRYSRLDDCYAPVMSRTSRRTTGMTSSGVRVGPATVSIRFERQPDGSASHEILDQAGRLLIIEAPPPQDVTGASPLDAVKAWAIAHAPGRQARALRIGLGLEREESWR